MRSYSINNEAIIDLINGPLELWCRPTYFFTCSRKSTYCEYVYIETLLPCTPWYHQRSIFLGVIHLTAAIKACTPVLLQKRLRTHDMLKIINPPVALAARRIWLIERELSTSKNANLGESSQSGVSPIHYVERREERNRKRQARPSL
jgi:hypothetical protein